MMRKLGYVLLTFCCYIANAQSSDTTFLDADYRLSIKAEAQYYRTYEPVDSLLLRRIFYLNHQLKEEVLIRSVLPGEKVGAIVKYYKNGQLELRAYYNEGAYEGDFDSYFENGQQHVDAYFSNKKGRYEQIWDSSGLELLNLGTGDVLDSISERATRVNRYLDYAFECSFDIRHDKGDTVFNRVEQLPEFGAEGLIEFYQHVGRKVKYPSRAVERGNEGKVFVELIISSEGKLTEVEVVRGIGDGCDEEALRAVNSATNWKPAMYRGKPVNCRMVLPIHFKLQ